MAQNLVKFLGITCTLYADCTVLEAVSYILYLLFLLAGYDVASNIIWLLLDKICRRTYQITETELVNLRGGPNTSRDNDESQPVNEIKVTKPTHRRLSKAIAFNILCTEAIICVFLLISWDILVMYDTIPSDFRAALMKLLLMMFLLIILTYRYCFLFDVPYKIAFTKLLRYTIAFFLIAVVYTVSVMILTVGLCTCYHNDKLPGFVFTRRHYSTSFIRRFSGSTCDESQIPCLTYVTLPEEALDGVFVNFHINTKSCGLSNCDPDLYYAEYNSNVCYEEPCDDSSSTPSWIPIEAVKSSYVTPNHEYEQRNVFSGLIIGLEEAKSYVIKITEPNQSKPAIFLYKNFDPNSITVVAGGDVGSTDASFKMNENTVAPANPDLIIIGGDLAYDDNKKYCYQAWDFFLDNLPITRVDEETGLTRLIPGIYGPGNHDAGISAYGNANVKHDDSSPVYKHFLPQNTYNGDVPDIHHRYSYFANRIGNTLLVLSLDSGYLSRMDGEQKAFIESELSRNDYRIKIAHYHDSIYPGFDHTGTGSQTEKVAPIGREHWAPLFDEYNMTVVFENHNHFFKRTKQLKYGAEHENGTYYLGEGSWGLNMGAVMDYDTGYIEKAGDNQTVWIFNITGSDYITYEARNEQNVLLDRFESKIV